MDGEPTNPGTRHHKAYEIIKSAILTNKFAPGQPLVETELATYCAVSRTPIREALNRLQHDGLVVRGARGLVVRDCTPDELLDIYETRIPLEGAAARLAAERRSSRDLIRLRQIASQMAKDPEAPTDRLVDLNAQFHRSIWSASHNATLVDLLERLELHLVRYQPGPTLQSSDKWQTSMREHLALVEAIERRDDGEALRIAEAHFMSARDVRLQLWAAADL